MLTVGRFKEAIIQYQTALTYEPRNNTALEELGFAKRAETSIDSGNREMEAKSYHKALAHYEIANNWATYSDDLKLLKVKEATHTTVYTLANRSISIRNETNYIRYIYTYIA